MTKKSTLCLFLFLCVLATLSAGCEKFGRRPPVTITFRESLLDSTRVVQVTNRSGSETLVMKLEVWNDEQNEYSSYVFKFRPGNTYEIGRMEMNWVFVTGERIKLSADGYSSPCKCTVP